ncbi:MAG TPA: polymer-forming cytoskeletal protein [Bacteroidales bacterium]|nr:polymer-forming cytoskeletal protein [Bacteroidales bacterium]HPT52202.1 polymer-forming cytoskeletal protein [Bacteroidales bacterium]
MVKLYESGEVTGVNIIAAGTTLVGDIVANGDCRIDGNIKGNVKCRSKVIIGQTGELEGDVTCESIEMEGKVKANVSATDIISLKATAVLIGNIVASKLSIEPGANFVGNCKIQNGKISMQPAQPAPENK